MVLVVLSGSNVSGTSDADGAKWCDASGAKWCSARFAGGANWC